MNVHVQGARRSYAAGLLPDGRAGILKNQGGYRLLQEKEFPWEPGKEYVITVSAAQGKISVDINGELKMAATDSDSPWMKGGIGLSVREGSHLLCSRIQVTGKGATCTKK